MANFPRGKLLTGRAFVLSLPVNLTKFSRLGLAIGGLLFQVCFFSRLQTNQSVEAATGSVRSRHQHTSPQLLRSTNARTVFSLTYDCREFTYAVYSEWFHPLHGKGRWCVEELCVRRADSVITVSDWIGDYLRKFNKEVNIIYNCPRLVDIPESSVTDARVQLGLPLDAFIVSHVGTIRYGCRLDLLLEVASQPRNDHVQFIVVGDGPLGPQFKEAARKANCHQLTVLPRTSRERALLHILASDLHLGSLFRPDYIDEFTSRSTMEVL